MADGDLTDNPNYEIFRDSFFTAMVTVSHGHGKSRIRQRPAGKSSVSKKPSNAQSVPQEPSTSGDPSELADFSDFIAAEIFSNLPEDLRQLSYQATQENPEKDEKWSLPLTRTTLEEAVDPIPPSVTDSLTAYGLIDPPKSDLETFVGPIVASYVSTVTTPPPKWIETRVTTCEICERDWVPLTYHHLIPRGVHAKVRKRGWHDEAMLNSVAWLCRACHTFVHKMATNEELAKDWYTVDKICSRDDVQKWAQWVSRVRWKKT